MFNIVACLEVATDKAPWPGKCPADPQKGELQAQSQ